MSVHAENGAVIVEGASAHAVHFRPIDSWAARAACGRLAVSLRTDLTLDFRDVTCDACRMSVEFRRARARADELKREKRARREVADEAWRRA